MYGSSVRFSADWAPNIVQGKGYDSEVEEGARIWSQVQLSLARRMPMEHAVAEHRYGELILVQPRLGQGAGCLPGRRPPHTP